MMKTACAMVLAIAAWAPTAARAEEKLQIEGSTTVGPIVDAFAEAMQKTHPGVSITVKKTGSGDGAAALIDSRCDIASMSRFMKTDEFKAAVAKDVMPVAHVVAMDGVCVIVHPSNGVSALTSEQIRDIFTGKISNWKDVGGADREIVKISRDTNSGTYESFEGLVMKKAKLAGDCEYVKSNPEVHARVSTTAGAIGYVGLGFVDNKVKALTVDGIMPTRKTISTGKYPIARPLFLFTNGYPALGSLVHEFVTFNLSAKGQDIIEARGFVPVTDY